MNLRRSLAGAVPVMLLGTLSLFAAAAPAQDAPGNILSATDAHTIITVMPKSKETAPQLTPANVAAKLDNKTTSVTGLTHYDSGQPNLELILLIDDSARSSLGLYMNEMSTFLTSLPPNVAVAVAYIENGSAHFVHPFTLDHAAAASTLRLPSSPPGASSDPYIALTELVKSWPQQTSGPSGQRIRHEVVLISNGVDAYGGLHYDPDNPYITNAISSAQKSGVIVYSIYYKDRGLAQRFGAAINSGQNYLIQMSEATGGELYYIGTENPVSFAPFFNEISRNLENQYELRLSVPPKVKDGLQSLKVKINAPNSKVATPSDVLVGGQTSERK
jgi:hypothetical protein